MDMSISISMYIRVRFAMQRCMENQGKLRLPNCDRTRTLKVDQYQESLKIGVLGTSSQLLWRNNFLDVITGDPQV